MSVYFSVLFFIILVCLLSYKEERNRIVSKGGRTKILTKNSKVDGRIPLGISILAIYLMITSQAGWGGDGEYYVNIIDYYHGMSLKDLMEDETHGEIGYKIAFAFLPSYTIINYIFSAWYCFALYILFYHFIPRKWWPLGFFFLFINRPMLMGGLCAIARTGFAVASFIISLYFLAKGQRWKFVVILLVASLFHTSALFFLPLVFLPTRPGKINALIGLAIFVAIFLFFLVLPSTWTGFVESLVSSSDTFGEYESYLEDVAKERSISVLIVFTFFWVYELFVHIGKTKYTRNDYLVMYIALVQIAFSLLPSVGLSGRFYYYLNYGFFAGMLVLLDKENDQTFKWIIILSLVFVFGKQFLTFARTPYFAEKWLYYHTYWNY